MFFCDFYFLDQKFSQKKILKNEEQELCCKRLCFDNK